MCNSYNHSYDCTCGFGGYGHKGSASGRGGSSSRNSPLGNAKTSGKRVLYGFHSFDSYINPNAHCPVCSAPVFFYQSPHGGRVYFDELGPPWPKHPCTDNRTSTTRASGSAYQEPNPVSNRQSGRASGGEAYAPSGDYAWQRQGWSPFLTTPVMHSDKWVKLSGLIASSGERLVLYASRDQVTLSNAPMLVRFDNGRYVLSSFRFSRTGQVESFRIVTEDSPPGAKAWSEYGDLAHLVEWFFSSSALPVLAFDLRVKDRFGTSLWVSDPPLFYRALNHVIALGPDATTRDQHRKLYEDLSALYRCFKGG